MDKCRLNIAIIEPSSIIYEGLSNIILQECGAYHSIYHFDTLEELSSELPTGKINIVIINPSLIKNDIYSFNLKKNSNHTVAWVGIVYSFFERETLSLFDAIIEIYDKPGVISYTIQKLNSSNCRNRNFGTPKDQLSPREIDVLKHLMQGLSNKEIAGQLNISIHTVISHRKNIVSKTGIKSQAGLTIYAISNNIIDIENP